MDRKLGRTCFLRSGYCERGCLHPHVHCVVPAGGLSADRTRWVKSRDDFFLPVKVLSRVFRGKFHEALKRAFQSGQLNFHGDLKLLAQPKTFAAWLRPLFRKDWVVYAKRPFGGPEYVLRYLGRYTHRVAISNHRLVSFADQKVTFRWRDSAHNNLSGVVNRAKSLLGGFLSGSTVVHLARGLNVLDVCFCPTADAFDQPT
jgi:hypothetical protein